MTDATVCPGCGTALPPGVPAGPCARCLLAAGLASGPGAERAGPPAPEEMARHFPHLEVLEVLGQGGMGVVYKARHRRLDRLVALKVLPPEAAREPGFPERFTREARTLARLQHPHIVAVHDFGETDGLFWLVMEFVDGPNLRQVMRSGGLEPRQALAIVPQVCEALQYAHDQGVVHRDVKPENILLDREGRVKIADFGLAKIARRAPVDLTLTRAGQVMGTLQYMAPEQYRAPDTVDHRADIYSLGVVFYEMLTGDLPLGVFPPPSSRARVDARLDAVVLRALEQERDRRWQSASEVKTQVDSIAAGSSVPPPRAAGAPGAPGAPEAAKVRNGSLEIDTTESAAGEQAEIPIGGAAVDAARDAAPRDLSRAADEADGKGSPGRTPLSALAVTSAFGAPAAAVVGLVAWAVTDALTHGAEERRLEAPVVFLSAAFTLAVFLLLGVAAWVRISFSRGHVRGGWWAAVGTFGNAALLCAAGLAAALLTAKGTLDQPPQPPAPSFVDPADALKVVGGPSDLTDDAKRAIVREIGDLWSAFAARHPREMNPEVRASTYAPTDRARWQALPIARRAHAERLMRLGIPFLPDVGAPPAAFFPAWVALDGTGTRARVVCSNGPWVLSFPVVNEGGRWHPALGPVELDSRELRHEDRGGWVRPVQGEGRDPAERVTGGPATLTPEDRAELAWALDLIWDNEGLSLGFTRPDGTQVGTGLRLFHAILDADGRSGRMLVTDGAVSVAAGFRNEDGWRLDLGSAWIRFGPAEEHDRIVIPKDLAAPSSGPATDADVERDACLVHGGPSGRSAAELAGIARAVRATWADRGPEYVRTEVPAAHHGAQMRIPGNATDYTLHAVALFGDGRSGRAVFGSADAAFSVLVELDGAKWVLGVEWEVRFSPPTKDDEDGLLFR